MRALKWMIPIHLGLAMIITAVIAPLLGATDERVGLYLMTFAGVYLLLWLLSFFYHRKHFYKLPHLYYLVLYFLYELLKANLKLAYEVVSIHDHMSPAVVAIPLDLTTDLEIMVFANLITLTPGTLSLDVSEDRKWLYVHTLYLDGGSTETFKHNLKKNFEQKILAITQ